MLVLHVGQDLVRVHGVVATVAAPIEAAAANVDVLLRNEMSETFSTCCKMIKVLNNTDVIPMSLFRLTGMFDDNNK